MGWGGQFPLLQKIPVLLMKSFGYQNEAVLHGLGVLSLVSFALVLYWGWRSLLRESARLAWFFLTVLLSGPLLWYGNSTFGEMLASLVTLGFVIAWREKAAGWKVLLFSVMASISKDTAFPFLLLLGLAAMVEVRDPDRTFGWAFHRWRFLLASILFGSAVSFMFNYMKFGSIFNSAYLNPVLIVPSIGIQLSFFLGIWFSPNGGVLFFWPSFCLLVVLGGVSAFRDVRRWTQAAPFLAVILVLAGLTFGFSKWFAPMGWVCWGPRLLLPWLPAAGYVLLTSYASEIERRLAVILGSGRRFVFIGVVFSLLALPHFIVLFQPEVMGRFFSPDEYCPEIAYIEKNPSYYYKCLNHGLWTKRSMLLDAFRPVPHAAPLALSLAYGIFLMGMWRRAKKGGNGDVPL